MTAPDARVTNPATVAPSEAAVICGKCARPIERGETGVRHFGFFTAHSENRCLELLLAEVERRENWVCPETYMLTLAAVQTEAKRVAELSAEVERLRAYGDACTQAEREACAKACEEVDLHSGDHLKNSDPRVTCAAAIRAR